MDGAPLHKLGALRLLFCISGRFNFRYCSGEVELWIVYELADTRFRSGVTMMAPRRRLPLALLTAGKS